MSALDALRTMRPLGTLGVSGRGAGIYRDEVMDLIGGLADISSDTLQILAILKGEDEEDHEEEEDDA